MKLKLSAKLLLIFCNVLSYPVVAQNDSIAVKKTKPYRGVEFTATIGLNFPVGGYGNDVDFSEEGEIEDITQDNLTGEKGGFGAKKGGQYDFSGYFAFKKHGKYTRWGLKATFLNFTSNNFSWYQKGDYVFNKADYDKVKLISMKIGPVLRIPLKNKPNALRIYYQLCPTHSWHGGWEYAVQSTYPHPSSDKAYFSLGKGNGIKQELGIAVNAKWFTFNAAFNFGKLKYKSVTYYRNFNYTVYSNASGHYETISDYTNENFESKAVYNSFVLGMGVIF